MAATVGTQAVPNTGSSMLVQLLESQRLENNVEVLAEGEETSANNEVSLPTPLAFYDFEGGDNDEVQLKTAGTGTLPYSVPLSEKEKGLQFTFGLVGNEGYVQIANPLLNNANVATAGATISLWVYRDDSNAYEYIWSFNGNQMMQFNGNGYLGYNNQNHVWFDFNHPNSGGKYNDIPVGELAMVTLTFGPEEIGYYVNGEAKTFSSFSGGDVAGLDSYQAAYKNAASTLLGHMTTATEFYLGKGYWWWGTFPGKADKLGFYDKALTADEVKALYDSQKDAYANPIDLNAKEDVTAQYIVNADFSDAEDMYKGWTNEGMPCDTERSATLGMPFMSENPGTANFDFYQVLEVPNGIYTVSVQCLSHVDTRNNYDAIRLYANDVRSIIPQNGTYGDNAVANVATTWTDNKELNRVTVANVMVDDGTLRIGISKSARKGSVCFDNFRLEKASLSDMMSAYNSMKADAENLGEANLQSDLKARLDAALVEPTEFTVDAYAEAYFTLQPVVDLCNAYISECPIETLIETCEAYSQNSVSTSATKATFDTAIAAAEAVDLSTVDINGLREAYNALEAARQAFVQNAVPNGGEGFDVTFQYMKNPNFDGGNADNWSGNMPKQIVNGVPEFWNSKFDFNQTLTNLPNGKYKIEVQARHFGTEGRLYAKTSAEAMAVEQVIIANTVSGTALGNGNLGNEATDMKKERESGSDASRISVEIDVTDGNLIIGMAANAEGSWIVFDDFHLIQLEVSAANLTLNEAGAYSVTTNTYANVTLTRTLKSDGKWNTFCVPFDMTAEQLEANDITDVRTLESANVEGKSVTLNFSESNLNAVEAGVPYLVKVDASYDGTINVENVLVSAAEPTTVSVEGGVSMTGNYAAGNVPTGAYFISDNAFYYADVETVVLKGFRAYINVNGTSEAAGANRLMINLDGEVTGIEDVLGEEAAEADKLVNVVSLDGMTVKAGVKKAEALDGLQKGIYIVDGKKYVVK